MPHDIIRTRILRNGANGWYWEVPNGRQVLQRDVALSLEGARAQADNAKHAATIELRLTAIPSLLILHDGATLPSSPPTRYTGT
jgi:hypothetical protein